MDKVLSPWSNVSHLLIAAVKKNLKTDALQLLKSQIRRPTLTFQMTWSRWALKKSWSYWISWALGAMTVLKKVTWLRDSKITDLVVQNRPKRLKARRINIPQVKLTEVLHRPTPLQAKILHMHPKRRTSASKLPQSAILKWANHAWSSATAKVVS